MKYKTIIQITHKRCVALFTRAWIEIPLYGCDTAIDKVALFTRAWIEIKDIPDEIVFVTVALFTRAWIEMGKKTLLTIGEMRRPLHEGVD